LVQRDGRLLLVRRVPKGLLGGLWELPGGELQADELPAKALERLLVDHLALSVQAGDHLACVKHAYTHFTALVELFSCTSAGAPNPASIWDTTRWVLPDELGQFGLTGVTVKLLAQLGYPVPER
jgi:A/G-specific adenine glycosylase